MCQSQLVFAALSVGMHFIYLCFANSPDRKEAKKDLNATLVQNNTQKPEDLLFNLNQLCKTCVVPLIPASEQEVWQADVSCKQPYLFICFVLDRLKQPYKK